MARQEIEEGEKPVGAFNGLIRQCLSRDEDWKAFYIEQMATVTPVGANERILKIYAAELEAERAYSSGDYATAIAKLQALLDSGTVEPSDKPWYLQEMARYSHLSNRTESQRLQIAAHTGNRLLLKPPSGVTVAKLTIVSQERVERITSWVSAFENYDQLEVNLSDILGKLVFGTKADRFEEALNELSCALGFAGERPDKEWKEGPDNLWALDDSHYILWECKSEVELTRAEINKHETEQMNRSSAWFEKHYPGLKVKRIIIHPAYLVASAAAFTHEVEVMRVHELKCFVKTARDFFKFFELVDLKDLSAAQIQKQLNSHKLAVVDLLGEYTKKPKSLKSD